MYACRGGHTATVKLLVDAGASVNVLNKVFESVKSACEFLFAAL
jgi:ankyrin repeat protein